MRKSPDFVKELDYVAEEEIEKFEKEFPHKTKHITDTQLFH